MKPNICRNQNLTGWMVLLLLGLISTSINAQHSAATDRAALIELYKATNGDNWDLAIPWDTTAPMNEWEGVATDAWGRVSSLNLWDAGLVGEIPITIGNLDSLDYLNLAANNLNAIPTSIGSLKALTIIRLYDSHLSGEIPHEIGDLTKLDVLDLSGNNLEGIIPDEIGNLVTITDLGLQRNELTGAIPASIGNLNNLRYLDLSGNKLTSLPNELGNLIGLSSLNLGTNNLVGDIPEWIGDMVGLEYLILINNEFTNSIPMSFGKLSNLRTLLLSNNQLTGAIPDTLGALAQLENLKLNINSLGGNIPEGLGRLANLQQLSLERNNLTGTIPDTIYQLTELTYLDLGDNEITGHVSSRLKNLSKLTDFYIDGNNLDSLPTYSNYDNFPLSLENYICEGNKLTFEDLENSRRLQTTIGVANKKGFDYIPQQKYGTPQFVTATFAQPFTISAICPGNPTNIQYKWFKDGVEIRGWESDPEYTISPFVLESDEGIYHVIAKNDIEVPGLELESEPIVLDVFVPCMAKDSLALVELFDHNGGEKWKTKTNWKRVDIVEGEEIPFPVSSWYGIELAYDPSDGCDHVVSIVLDSNNVSKELPDTLGSLTHLKKLSMSANQIDGNLSPSFARLDSLEYFDVSHNRISGSIPDSYYSLNQLKFFSVDSNFLFQDVKPALSNLSNLQYLNLANNFFGGEFPEEWSQLTNLQNLQLQNNGGISGSLPAAIGNLSQLEVLDISNNSMEGDIPDGLYTLAELKSLKMSENEFSESNLNQFASLTKLEELWLSDNSFNGTILNHLMGATNMKSLRIDQNAFSGSIPLNIGTLSKLEELWLQHNNFSNEIRASIGDLSNLKELRVNHNDLTGTFPENIWNCTQLQVLHVGNNRISGAISADINNLNLLKSASFEENLMVDLVEIDGDTILQELHVKNNILTFEDLEYNKDKIDTLDGDFTYNPQKQFGGYREIPVGEGSTYNLEIPCGGTANHYTWFKNGVSFDDLPEYDQTDASVYTFKNIQKSDSGYYHIRVTNDIITDLTLFSDSVKIIVEESCMADDSLALVALYEACGGENWTHKENWLTGRVSEWYGITATECDVVEIDLSLNGLVDTLPDAFFNLIGLQKLNLNNNQLAGALSSSLQQMISLEEMHLASNQLSELIPSELYQMTTLKSIDLSNNQIQGSIPTEIESLANLENLNLSRNRMSGALPGRMAMLTKLKNLYLNDNEFTGNFVAGDGSMMQLENVNIASNNFDGLLPQSLGDLSNLRKLNVSNNRFFGEVPAEINTLAYLNELKLDGNEFHELPSLEGMDSLNDVSAENNQLTFEDFEKSLDFVADAANLAEISFTYHPQDTFGTEQSIHIEEGLPLDMHLGTPGLYNQYAWWKDGVKIDDYPGDSILHFDAVALSDTGYYHVTVINDSVPNLELVSKSIHLTAFIPCMRRDSLALKALYDATDGDNWMRIDNWFTGPVSTWYGITADECDVYEIKLDNNNLAGYLPDEISEMVSLEKLNLSFNNITGGIPEDMDALTAMQSLSINNNKLSGWLPDCSDMEDLITLNTEHNLFLFGDLASSDLDPVDLDFTYDPQDTILALDYDRIDKAIWMIADDHLDHPDNQYEWYKDYIRIEGVTGTEIAIETNGIYYAMVKNGDEFSDLTIFTDTITIDDLKPETVNVDPINTIFVDGGHSTLFVVDNIENYPDNTLVVMTRWGNKIYETTGYNNSFDMKEYPGGTYYFVLHVKAEKEEKTIKSFIQVVKE